MKALRPSIVGARKIKVDRVSLGPVNRRMFVKTMHACTHKATFDLTMIIMID